ncbi:SCP2 domain-containing protein [Agaribacterium sp. ZY112]|uniref:ubiquinone biosynthesis accessory factor UbiJ n=1 Tax=Agaribacterium sp. ZY112 TaxID=3233574 RepID=UPI00352366B4
MSVKAGLLDPSILALAAKIIEKAINECLRYDPASLKRLEQLKHKRCCLVISDQQLIISLRISESYCELALLPDNEDFLEQADLCLKGELKQFQKLASEAKHSLAGSGVHAQGDIALLQAFADLVSDIDIDWQDAASDKLGPELSSALSIALKTLKQVLPSFKLVETQAHFAQLLHTEWQLVPHPEEVLYFQSQVNELRRDAERLEARLHQLTSQLANHNKKD